MDVSTIKMPVEKTEGEQHADTPQEFDSAFLQLLAALGLSPPVPPTVIDGTKPTPINSGLSRGIDVTAAAEAGSLATTGQEMTVKNASDASLFLAQTVQTTQNGTTEGFLAHVLTSVGKPKSDPTATVPAQPVAVGLKDASAISDALTVEGKPPLTVAPLPDVKEAALGIPQTTLPNGVPEAALTRLINAVSSGHVLKERGATPAVIPATIGLAPNAAIQPPVAQDLSIKQTSTSAQTLLWNAVMESSNLPESGKDNNSASADHNGGEERLPQAEAGANQATSAGTSFLSPQPAPAPMRSSANVEMPTVTAPLESPLPASVRFEVQQGDMGRIRVHLSVVDHTVYTNVMTERVEAHDFLVKGSERYEAGLAAHGLDVGRFQVDVQGQSREHADRGGAAWSQEQTPRHRAEPPNNAENPASEWQTEERKVGWENRMINVFA